VLYITVHWLILSSVAEFPDQASIADLVENEAIKRLARSSIVYSACSAFPALSGNSDLHLHSTGRKAAFHLEREESVGEGSEDESDSEEEEDEEEHREPIEHLLKVRQATVVYFYIVAISCHFYTECYITYGLLTKCVVKRAGYWSRFMDRDVVEVHKHPNKERGQYPAILTEQTWSIKDLLYGFLKELAI